MQPIESQFPTIKAKDERWQSADKIWVLACYHYNNDELPDVSRWNECSLQRLVHAFMMYKEKAIPIILTGGDFTEEQAVNYAEKAALFLNHLGVKNEHLIILNEGTNTSEELDAVVKYKDYTKLAVVSSSSHGLRLSSYMSKRAVPFIFIPVDHQNTLKPKLELTWPQLSSINRSTRAIYVFFANIEAWFE